MSAQRLSQTIERSSDRNSEQKQPYLERLTQMVETVTDAAEMLGVSRTRVLQLIAKGDLEAYKVGKGVRSVWLISALSLQERIDAGTVKRNKN